LSGYLKRWEKLGTTRGANDFSLFLDRLRDSLHFHQDEFKFAICTWLNKLADDAELRTLIFAVAQEGVGSCEDRAQLTLNTMHTAAINLDVTRAQYDTQLDQLLACARVMFRLQTLENIARKKAATLPLVDEIEVYLAYQVKLRTQLDLPIAATMRFFEVSHVTQDDLDTALLQIKHKEEMEFLSYLSTDWGPWQTVLHRLTPSAYQILQETISDTVDHDFKTRQTHFLQSNNIDDNEYNRAKTTQTVLKNIAYEINNEFTLSFLSERNIKI